MTIQRTGQTPIMHRVVRCGGMLHFGGITAGDTALGMQGQTAQCLERLDALLVAAGSDRSKVISATIYLSDFAGKGEMNAAWTAYFAPEALPARATIGVADLGAGVLVEIVVTAAA